MRSRLNSFSNRTMVLSEMHALISKVTFAYFVEATIV